MSRLLRPNDVRHPDWPQPPKGKGGTPEERKEAQEAYERALQAIQGTVPYYGFPLDDGLDWREVVLEAKASVETTVVRPDGVTEKTYAWYESGCPVALRKGTCVRATPKYRYGEWQATGALLQRYVYVGFDIVEAT